MSSLGPSFRKLLAQRGFTIDRDAPPTPREALDLYVEFYRTVAFDKRSQDVRDGTFAEDMLLFQMNTFDGRTDINVTRQLYGGAGRIRQLGLTHRYPATLLDLGGRSITSWSSTHPTLDAWRGAALAELDALAPLPATVEVTLDLDRF